MTEQSSNRQTTAYGRGMTFLVLNTVLVLVLLLCGCSRQEGKVLNAEDNTPIAGARIFHNGQVVVSDGEGRFKLTSTDLKQPLIVKAPGYKRTSVPLKRYLRPDVRLGAFQAKALYLSHAGVGASHLRDPALRLIEQTDLNAVVVDVKGQRGLFSFSWEISEGHRIGAFSKITIDDPDEFIRQMHEKDIYVIGRISVFKDEALGNNKSDWAAIDPRTDKAYRDGDKIPWTDPFNEEVWNYNLAIAKAAAEVGFDEIQFDYLRFPVGPVKLAKENTPENREEAVTGFLKRAQKELEPYNVFISVVVSGDTLFREGDARIGQTISVLAPLVDYISPNIYPSDLPSSALNLSTNAPAIPGEAVAAALSRAIERAGNNPQKIRPWLQGFKDYTRLRLEYKEEEIAQEITASARAGTAGWMLFNPENKYPYISGALEKVRQSQSQTAKAAP